MSACSKFVNWCRMPPEPPKNSYKKLLAGSLIFTVLSVSLFAILPLFNVGIMTEESGALVTPSVVLPGTALSVANIAEGPKYIQNVTYQCINDTYQPAQDNNPMTLRFSSTSSYRNGDLGNITAKLVNHEDINLTIMIMEIYHNRKIFAVINGPFTLDAHSEGTFNFLLYNLTELSKNEVQWLTGKDTTSSNWAQYWYPVRYYAVIKTPEGIGVTDDCFFFPTAPGNAAA